MDADGDAESLPSSAARCRSAGRAGAARARRSREPRGEAEAAMLALRDEATHAKQRERAAEEKMRQLAAQLARTEEAAKRILTRTDPSARGGTAQRLLEAERELAGARAELAELGSQLARAKRQAADRKAQAAELKSRLDAALSAQRQLALQLGRVQAGAGAARNSRAWAGIPPAGALRQPDFESGAEAGGPVPAPTPGEAQPVCSSVEAEAAAARRFAVQQEQLAAAQEQRSRLEAQLRRQREVGEAQARELSTLRSQLAAAASRAAGPQPPGSAQQQSQRQDGRSSILGHGRSISAGSELHGSTEGGGGSAWLRLRHLESRTVLERSTASNTRLLRELESTRGQVQALQRELSWREQQLEQEQEQERGRQRDRQLALAALQQPGQTMHGRETEAQHAAWPHGTSAASGSTAAFSARGQRTSSTEPAPLPTLPAAAVLQLKQQLAEANHRAARLQIELDAALAKLAVFQEQGTRQGQVCSSSQQAQQALQQHPMQSPHRQLMSPRAPSMLPLRTLQLHHSHACPQPEVQQEGSWCRTGRTSTQGTGACSGADRSQAEPAAEPLPQVPSSHAGPALVELHLHAAELDESSPGLQLAGAAGSRGKGPLFLTADLPGFATAMTPVVEGVGPLESVCRGICAPGGACVQHGHFASHGSQLLPDQACTAAALLCAGQAPVFNTTLQFVADGTAQPLAALAAGTARVELHRCTASSGGTADYVTLASAWLQLGGLLTASPGTPAASQRQHCTLVSKDGAAVGSLWFGLSAQPTSQA
ncbi:hypothetical protein ABPG75_001401 [Micractinium tetrahymenae]